jgi:hypothetical protein
VIFKRITILLTIVAVGLTSVTAANSSVEQFNTAAKQLRETFACATNDVVRAFEKSFLGHHKTKKRHCAFGNKVARKTVKHGKAEKRVTQSSGKHDQPHETTAVSAESQGPVPVPDPLSLVKGSWICQSGCSCSPASPNRYTSIKAEGVARNECGGESAVDISAGRIEAKDWSIAGTVSPDNASISWDNGSVWIKQPPTVSELEGRMAYWESRTFYCPSADGPLFPSKEAEGGAPACDDGDAVMFNALLCRSGDARGCNTVRLSQDEDGRWWRSPEKRRLRPEEPSNPIQGGQTTFSGDHAAGLFIYFGVTHDSAAFQRWIRWIDSNERCLTWCGIMPAGTPRYCKNDRCALRRGDCPILLLLGKMLNVGVPFCSSDPIELPIPTVTNVAKTLENIYDETIGKLPVQIPGLAQLRDAFDKALKAYQNAIAPIEALRTQLEASIVQDLALAQLHETIAALINARGYSRHNALAQIMMLEDWDLGRHWMNDAARSIANNEPLNPFFQFVAFRRENRDAMLTDILQDCPDASTEHRLRREWAWERDSRERAWDNTVYWDCLFVARMYLEPGAPAIHDDFDESGLRAALAGLIATASQKEQELRDALKKITDIKVPGVKVDTKITIDEKSKDNTCRNLTVGLRKKC